MLGKSDAWRHATKGAGAILLCLLFSSAVHAVDIGQGAGNEPAAVSFTNAQVKAGHKTYMETCAVCHGAELQGGAGPALSGQTFKQLWLNGRRKAGELLSSLGGMPLDAPGSLGDTKYNELVAYLLSSNGYPAGGPAFDASMTNVVLTADGKSARLIEEDDGIQPHSKLDLPATPVHVGKATTALPQQSEIESSSDADWLLYNRDYRSQRFSKLDQINTRNADKLVPKCILQLGEVGTFQSGPVVYKGVLYLTTPNKTVAVDATSCQRVWTHDYVPSGRSPNPVNRGVALYEGKIFRATSDGHLIAIDAATGKLLWDAHVADTNVGYFLSAAPIAYDGKVFIGEAGAEWGAVGHIHAFDVNNGKRVWTFRVIPQGDEPGAETWGNTSAETGGGSMWTTMTLDTRTKRLFVSVGNPAPDFDGSLRPGDNLYTDSVVALDIATGKLDWYVQQIPHDVRDYDTAAAPVIYEQGGRKFLAVASKDGLLYLYDRDTRNLITSVPTTTRTNLDVKPREDKPIHVCPGVLGGTQWNGPAYSPVTGTLYVNSVDFCAQLQLIKQEYVAGDIFMGGKFILDPADKATGWTYAFDAATGAVKWKRKATGPMIAGVTPTAGGVIFTGESRGDFITLDAATGDVLYRFNTGGAVAGGVMTYAVDGQQYVAAVSGNTSRSLWGHTGSATLVIFGLP